MEVVDDHKATPLVLADSRDVTRQLLKAGVDVHAKDVYDQTVFDTTAHEYGREWMLKCIMIKITKYTPKDPCLNVPESQGSRKKQQERRIDR